MGFFNKIKDGLRKTRENISGSIESMLHSFTKIDEELFEELEELLVMGDVGIHTAERICEELRGQVKKTGTTDPNDVMALLKDVVAEMLSGGEALCLDSKPTAILIIGVNGVGKTTTIGKIAARLKGEGKSVVLGAADTFRAAAIDQLEVWSERAGVPLVKREEGSDPASVVFDTIAKAKSMDADVLICDTAGRLHNKKNLMDELGKMSRIIDRELPDCTKEVLLVLDATTGQNAVNQAREFKNAAGITGIVLTKLDGTAKGGVVLAIREELQLPVKFIGVGEQIDDLQPFDAKEFAQALFDNRNEVDEETAARIAEQNARYDAYGELIDEEYEEEKQPEMTAEADALEENGQATEWSEAPSKPEEQETWEPNAVMENIWRQEIQEDEPVKEEVSVEDPGIESMKEPEWDPWQMDQRTAEAEAQAEAPYRETDSQQENETPFDDDAPLTLEEEMAASEYEADVFRKETREERKARKLQEKEEKRRLKEERKEKKKEERRSGRQF